jgi:hypothetical protein
VLFMEVLNFEAGVKPKNKVNTECLYLVRTAPENHPRGL